MTTVNEKNVVVLPIVDIVPDPDNIREYFDEDDINDLAANLVEIGQTDPIEVFERGDGKYDLTDGERRWRAATLAGLPTLEAIVVPRPTDEELLYKKVSRALQSRNLTPQEEVKALDAALVVMEVRDKPGEWLAAARKLGISSSLLRDRMKITALSPKVREAFEEGRLDLTAAAALGRLHDSHRQETVAKFIDDNHLSTRFVSTTFIRYLVQNPEMPVLQVFATAQTEHPGLVSHDNKHNEAKTLADRLDEMLRDFQKAEGWLIKCGKEQLMAQLEDRGDYTGEEKLIIEIQRLGALCRSFVKSAGSNDDIPEIISLDRAP